MTPSKTKANDSFYSHPRRVLWISGLASLFAYLYLAMVSQEYASASLGDLYIAVIPTALISFYCFHYLNRACIESRCSSFDPLILIIGFAVLFRIVGIATYPILEDDFFRYLWDGRLLVEKGSPYGIAPSEFFSDETLSSRFESILDTINYPYIATVYGPVCQWFFGAAYLIAPGELWPLKVFFVIADLIIIALLYFWLKKLNLNYHALILYAWSPLIIKEIAISLHPDVLAVCFSLAALLALSSSRSFLAAILIALAVGGKVFALLLVPLILQLYWQRWLLFAAVIATISYPLGFIDAWIPEGLSAMAQSWFFNAPFYKALSNFVSFTQSKIILLSLLAAFWLAGFYYPLYKGKPIESLRYDYLFGVFLLCIPVLNAWYLIWLLPFGVLFFSYWLWAASVLVLLISYSTGINTNHGGSAQGLYELPTILLVFEFGVVLLLFIIEQTIQRNKKRPQY